MLTRQDSAAPLLLACLLMAPAAEARFAQQGAKLVGTGVVGAASQGYSLALSADGNTAVVGGYYDNSNQGAVWVYVRSGGVWSQQGAKLVGTGAAGVADQGWSVALSADGNTAVVGGYNDNGNQGAAWVFVRSGVVWSQQGLKLVGTGAAGGALQGVSIAISSDGNTAVVGGSADNGYQGAAWVFVRSGGVWSQQGTKLVGTGTVGATVYQGYCVAISANGNTAVVGGYADNSGQGAAWVYVRSGVVWSQQGLKLVGTGVAGAAQQGYSVALSANGNTAVVGGYADNSYQGAAWVFVRSGVAWSQQGAKLVGTGAVGAAEQGVSVALSADGSTAVVGGSADNNFQGAAWVYVRSGVVWSQQGVKLVGSGAMGTPYQGYSVALSADGNTALVGGYYDNSGQGAAWVFVRASPLIVSITDVPNDQGGRVSIRWTASLLDNAPGNTIDAYWIWRQVPLRLAAALAPGAARLLRAGAPAGPGVSEKADTPPGRALRPPPEGAELYYWEFVASQVADGLPAYSFTAPTLFDSIPGSNPYTLFMVETKRLLTGEGWSSDPDSGYSVDNLPPAVPAPFSGQYSASNTALHWGPNEELDFAHYNLYRGTSSSFVPSAGNLVVSKPDTGYAYNAGQPYYYKLSAVDIHGNESGFALVQPAGTTDAPPPGASALFLAAAVPNPLREEALIRFGLSRDSHVTLAIYDQQGRRVRGLVSGMQPAGELSVRWDRRDDSGRTVPSGLYFLRLEAEGQRFTERLVAIR